MRKVSMFRTDAFSIKRVLNSQIWKEPMDTDSQNIIPITTCNHLSLFQVNAVLLLPHDHSDPRTPGPWRQHPQHTVAQGDFALHSHGGSLPLPQHLPSAPGKSLCAFESLPVRLPSSSLDA